MTTVSDSATRGRSSRFACGFALFDAVVALPSARRIRFSDVDDGFVVCPNPTAHRMKINSATRNAADVTCENVGSRRIVGLPFLAGVSEDLVDAHAQTIAVHHHL